MVNLPFIQKKEGVKKYFLSLLIKPFRVGAILFEEVDKKLFIISTKEDEQEKEVNALSSEDLVQASDKVVSYIESSIKEDHILEKTIFSVPFEWVEEGKIKSEYLEKLKKVCADLGLKPEGFIISIEAIVKFLQEKEGAPISSIFVEVAKDIVFIYIVKAGKILEVRSAVVEKNISKTVENLLLEIKSLDVLPSKLVLLDYDDAENIQQEFLSYSWSKEIPFLHVPQVVVLEKGFENEAIINGVATELGTQVFSDIRAGRNIEAEEDFPIEEASSDEFGFLREEDLAKKKKEGIKDELVAVDDSFFEDKENEKNNLSDLPYKPGGFGKKNVLKNILAIIPSIPFSKRNFNFFPKLIKKIPAKTGIIVGVVAFLIFAFLASVIYYNIILKANITVFSDKKIFTKDTQVDFLTNKDFSESTFKIASREEKISGEKSRNVTGKKETGEKAAGELTIYNKTDEEKSFSKGSIFIGTNNLEFVILDNVKIASTSSFSTSFSNVKVKAEASTFGREYNLPSGTNFTAKGQSTSNFFARNDTAFTGGTKKEIKVVSKKDIEEITSSFVSELERKAIQEAGSKNPDFSFLPVSLNFEFKDKSINKKEGDEATSISLIGDIAFTLGYYKKDDLEKFVRILAGNEVPGNFSLNFEDSEFDIEDVKSGDDNSANGKVKIKAVFVPGLESEKIKKEISGKNTLDAEKIMKDIKGVSDVIIILKNKFPLFPELLPRNSKNISIEIKS